MGSGTEQSPPGLPERTEAAEISRDARIPLPGRPSFHYTRPRSPREAPAPSAKHTGADWWAEWTWRRQACSKFLRAYSALQRAHTAGGTEATYRPSEAQQACGLGSSWNRAPPPAREIPLDRPGPAWDTPPPAQGLLQSALWASFFGLEQSGCYRKETRGLLPPSERRRKPRHQLEVVSSKILALKYSRLEQGFSDYIVHVIIWP